jgi:hypothetical protein
VPSRASMPADHRPGRHGVGPEVVGGAGGTDSTRTLQRRLRGQALGHLLDPPAPRSNLKAVPSSRSAVLLFDGGADAKTAEPDAPSGELSEWLASPRHQKSRRMTAPDRNLC